MRYLALTVMYTVLILGWSTVYTVATMFLGYPKGGIPFFFFACAIFASGQWCHTKINVWFLARDARKWSDAK